MSVIVLGVGALVLLYCTEYFHHHDGRREDRLPSFAAQLVAFAGAMFGLVTADNLLLLYVFWELTTVLSFLLVGHYAERATSRVKANDVQVTVNPTRTAELTEHEKEHFTFLDACMSSP